MRGKGLPCLQICVGSFPKALQPPLDVLSRNASVQWDELCSTEQCAAFAHGALATNRLDIRGLLIISRYMWCYVDVLVFLRLAIAFKQALFPGLPIGRLTVDSLSVDLHEGSSNIVLCSI